MEHKKDIDWSKLGFGYTATEYRWQATWENGSWTEDGLVEDPKLHLYESACVFQYSQSCFEGLKAYRTKEGKIVTFRPDMNAERMYNSAQRLEMPPLPKELFLKSIDEVVRANAQWVPPYGTGCSLYIRPF
ncbi:MAG: branched chain amino acid aminotransferase, partial [Sutterella wadsworthensis]|nr:branched chain amino acid aminotransferase [Sutterella wadsworthensis]